jgi:hypothetical protein
MKRTALTALLAVALPVFLPVSPAFADSPTIEKITAAPSPAKVGQPVTITIDAQNAAESMCGLDLNWGDGNREKPKKVGGNHKPFPLTFQHTYSKPGTYEIKADGKRAETYLGCMGKVKYMITVEAAAAAATAAMPAKPACPVDWALKGKAAKDGSYTCTPKKKGAAKPEKAIDCPAGTSYFMSSKALGCEKAN